MTDSKITPGPWKLIPEDEITYPCIVGADGTPIAVDGFTREADACAIATLPELIDIAEDTERLLNPNNPHAITTEKLNELERKVKKALAKVRGE